MKRLFESEKVYIYIFLGGGYGGIFCEGEVSAKDKCIINKVTSLYLYKPDDDR